MKRRVVAALSVVGFLAVASLASGQDAKVERGMKVYAAQQCSICHSIQGKGNPKGALDGVGSKLSATEIREWIVDPKKMTEKTKAERKPPMKAYPNLPAEDLDALVAYLGSLKKK